VWYTMHKVSGSVITVPTASGHLMTKAQELKLLDQMIKRLGDNSYLGPWLKKHQHAIIDAIANDLPIDL
jgi:hypothetical protein